MNNKKYLTLILSIIMIIMSSVVAFANSAEPPVLTIIINSPPEDIKLSVQSSSGESFLLEPTIVSWEYTYHLFSYDLERANMNLSDLIINVESSSINNNAPLPMDAFNQYNGRMTLDIETMTFTDSTTLLREVLLISLRLSLTLIIEGAIFYIFLYRNKKSWITFLIINLITQGGLNILLSMTISSYAWILLLFFAEFIIVIAELVLFYIFLKEHGKVRPFFYVITANFLSLVAGIYTLALLPI